MASSVVSDWLAASKTLRITGVFSSFGVRQKLAFWLNEGSFREGFEGPYMVDSTDAVDNGATSEHGTVTVQHLRDLTPDPENRRQHNPRNVGMIVDSLHRVGAGRPIVIDEDSVILCGNATVDAAAEAGIEHVRIIEASGHELIAVRRRGLTSEQKRHLALSDNRAAELATWNLDQLRADADAGLDLASFFAPAELADLLGADAPVPKFEPEVPAHRLDELAAHCPTCRCRDGVSGRDISETHQRRAHGD